MAVLYTEYRDPSTDHATPSPRGLSYFTIHYALSTELAAHITYMVHTPYVRLSKMSTKLGPSTLVP